MATQMTPLKSWFQQAVTTFLDSDRETRVQTLVDVIQRGIQVQGQQFSLRTTLGGLQYSPQDMVEAQGRVYRSALERGWSDGTLSAGEQKTAQWLASRLELPADESRKLNFEQARKWFGLALAQAMQDGVLDGQEESRLQTIAASVGCNLPQFARAFFQNEGHGFLRSIFLACVADNSISQSDWNYLLHVTQQLGLQQHEMLEVVQPQARQFVERVLAEAKSDGRISPQEQQTLGWLLNNLGLPADFHAYAVSEMRLVQSLADIDEGRLPSVAIPQGMEHRSGEIVHWVGPVTWREHRTRQGELYPVDRAGLLALTDNRLIFAGDMKSKAVSYRRIVAHRGTDRWLEVQMEGKPVYQYHFRQPAPVPYAIFRSAVAMANQTKLAKLEGGNTRHIPRDVRQRVWQRYGGRCAECSATTYLEYDHIIPVARGGSNTDANVQLLCRGCNQKKSDFI
jgi:tellurite resistance protein